MIEEKKSLLIQGPKEIAALKISMMRLQVTRLWTVKTLTAKIHLQS